MAYRKPYSKPTIFSEKSFEVNSTPGVTVWGEQTVEASKNFSDKWREGLPGALGLGS